MNSSGFSLRTNERQKRLNLMNAHERGNNDITDLQVVRGELHAVAFLSSIVAEERFIV